MEARCVNAPRFGSDWRTSAEMPAMVVTGCGYQESAHICFRAFRAWDSDGGEQSLRGLLRPFSIVESDDSFVARWIQTTDLLVPNLISTLFEDPGLRAGQSQQPLERQQP